MVTLANSKDPDEISHNGWHCLEKQKTSSGTEVHPNFEKIIDINETEHEISNNMVCTTSKASDQPAHTV